MSKRANESKSSGADDATATTGEPTQSGGAPMMRWAPMLVLVVLSVTVYARSIVGNYEFVFDDRPTVVDNEHLRTFWPLTIPMDAPDQSPLVDRPVSSISLAANYAITGGEPWGFRMGNLILHTLTALLLFGVVRRTLTLESMGGRFAGAATGLALAVAAVWTVHPLNTEAVVYVTQRTELMMAFCFVLTLYCAIRWWTEPDKQQAGGWLGAAIMACALGMGSKQTMVVAPLVVLLYDRAFISGTFSAAISKHKALHVALVATWAILVTLLLTGESRDESLGWGLGMSSWDYLRIQAGVILRYLQLVFVPYPLLIHYHWPVPDGVLGWLLPGLVVLALLGLTVWALQHRPRWGVLGAWVFLALAPSSSIVPIVTEVGAERRMYLPLMAIVSGLVVGVYLLVTRKREASRGVPRGMSIAAAVLVAALAVGAFVRVGTWRSAESIWRDVIAKAPHDALAYNSLGDVYMDADPPRLRDAVEQLRKAVHLQSDQRRNLPEKLPPYIRAEHTLPLMGLGVIARNTGDIGRAEQFFREALEIDPTSAKLHSHLGVLSQLRGQPQQAKAYFQEAIELEDSAEARFKLAVIHEALGEVADAEREYKRAIELENLSDAHDRLGWLYFRHGRIADAELHLQKAIEEQPRNVSARMHVAELRLARKQVEEALNEYLIVLELRPEHAEAHFRAGLLFAEMGRMDAAVIHLQNAVTHAPKDAMKWMNLGDALLRTKRDEAAVKAAQRAVEMSPDDAAAHNLLGRALASVGQVEPAIEAFKKAVQFDEDNAVYHDHLGVALARHGKPDAAASAFRKALEIDPKLELAQKHLDAVLKGVAAPEPDATDASPAPAK